MEVVAEVKKLVDTQLNLEDEIARLQKETLLQDQSLKRTFYRSMPKIKNFVETLRDCLNVFGMFSKG